MLGRQVLDGRVLGLHELGEGEPDLRGDVAMHGGEPAVAGAVDHGPVKGEVGLHQVAPGGIAGQPSLRRQRASRSLGDRASGCQAATRLDLDRRSQFVDLDQVPLREHPDKDAAVAGLDQQPAPGQPVEGSPQGVAPDVVLPGQLDLAQVRTRLELAVQRSPFQVLLEGLDGRDRPQAAENRGHGVILWYNDYVSARLVRLLCPPGGGAARLASGSPAPDARPCRVLTGRGGSDRSTPCLAGPT